jgi:hypothetical protein
VRVAKPGDVRPWKGEKNTMSTIMSRLTKATALTQVQALIAGTEKHFPNGTFTLGNTAYTTATLTQAFQSLADALSALSAAHVRVKDAVLALRGIEATVGPLTRDYKSFVLAAFRTASAQLADFGLQAPKARTPLTSEQRAAAAAKMRSTRAARGTTSKKQKLGVKGDVTAVTITPVKKPSASSPSAAPAVPASTVPASGAAAK